MVLMESCSTIGSDITLAPALTETLLPSFRGTTVLVLVVLVNHGSHGCEVYSCRRGL